MPVPKPLNEEKNADYTKRCMSDSKMIEEFPSQAQRYAVCQVEWKRSIKEYKKKGA